MSNDVEILAPLDPDKQEFELGTWLGRRHAFSTIASRCSAADAECLRRIREEKLYKLRGLTWAEFCVQYVGLSRPYADHMIRMLEEFGPTYFHLTHLIRISTAGYREIARAISQDGITYAGETIPLVPEYIGRILEAVTALRAAAQEPTDNDTPEAQQGVAGTAERLERAVEEFCILMNERLEPRDHQRLCETARAAGLRLTAVLLAN